MLRNGLPTALDGIWDFAFIEGATAESLDAAKVETPETAVVPGCYDVSCGRLGKKGTGVFRRKVWTSGLVRLRIDGCGLWGKISWDNNEIGQYVNPWGCTEWVFDAGTDREHILTIALDNVLHPGEPVLFHMDYDMYGFCGVFGSVTLAELPEAYIEQVRIVTLVPKTGEVSVKIVLAGNTSVCRHVSLSFDDTPASKAELTGAETTLLLHVPDPHIWSPETPHLHKLRINVGDGLWEGSFGLRTVECRDGLFLLNGKPVKLIGYNRHESHPEFGAAVPASLMLEDLRMIREQGCNFIRGSHYPQREVFLSLCDRLGILVWDEALGWGDKPNRLCDPVFQERQIAQAVSMVHFSANHPSVVIWAFLNEADTRTPETREIVSRLKTAILNEDNTRPVTFATCVCENCTCLDLADIISFNVYPGWYQDLNKIDSIESIKPRFDEIAEFASRPEFRDKPLMITEIGAAAILGQHSGVRWSEEYQARLLKTALTYILNHPRYSGLAIWQFSNHRSCIQGPVLLQHPSGLNNKGVLDEFRRPKLAWHVISELLENSQTQPKNN